MWLGAGVDGGVMESLFDVVVEKGRRWIENVDGL